MPPMFIEKTEKVKIKNHRGALPCDFHEMIQVRTIKHKDKCHENHHTHVLRYSTDSFHMSPIDRDHSHEEHNDPTYKIQGRVIFTSIKDCDLEIAYTAIAVDDEGYPLIPDKSTFTRALELYIKKQYFTILFDMGRIQQGILQNTQQEYSWAVGQAQSDMIRPPVDEMQSITNSLNTLLPRVNEHSRGFRTNGRMERIKLQ